MEQTREEDVEAKKKNKDEISVEVVDLTKYETSVKIAKRQAILSQFKEYHMRYHDTWKDDDPVVSVVCGIAKMLVGELVETARLVMVKSNETGPIRPCHIRESYRRLKLQGKVPHRSVPRLFR